MASEGDSLSARLSSLGLQEEDFEEQFIRSSGKGGQNVNKVSTAVWLVHRPSGLSAKVMTHRTQAANREEAWTRLLEQIAAERERRKAEARDAAERERRKARRPSKAARARNVASKRRDARRRADRRGDGD